MLPDGRNHQQDGLVLRPYLIWGLPSMSRLGDSPGYCRWNRGYRPVDLVHPHLGAFGLGYRWGCAMLAAAVSCRR